MFWCLVWVISFLIEVLLRLISGVLLFLFLLFVKFLFGLRFIILL